MFALKERELYAARLCSFWSQILSKLFRKSLKFLTKKDTTASFKCNLHLLRYLLGLMFLCNIMTTLFALHNFLKLYWPHLLIFYFHHRVELETISVLLSNFRELARLKTSRDICSGDLLEDRSFVPTCSKYTSVLKSLARKGLTFTTYL